MLCSWSLPAGVPAPEGIKRVRQRAGVNTAVSTYSATCYSAASAELLTGDVSGNERDISVWCGGASAGTKYCKRSVTIDEDLLKQAILTAANRVMASQEDLTDKLISAMREELLTIPGEGLSLSDIDRALENLANQFDQLLKEASLSADSSENAEQFRRISTAMSELKERRAQIEKLHRENEQMYRRTKAAEAALPAASAEITEWKEDVLYQLLEKVTVLDEARIKVTFRSGVEIEQALEKDERSVTA